MACNIIEFYSSDKTFFLLLPPCFLLSFILMYTSYLTELQGELAATQDNLSAQSAVRWWLSRGFAEVFAVCCSTAHSQPSRRQIPHPWHWLCTPQFLLILAFFMGGGTRFPLNWKTWSCRTAANNGRTSGSVWSKDHLRHTCPTH